MITILLADDHPVTLAGIRHILNDVPDFRIVGEAQSGSEVLQLVAELRPRILLLDLVMPGMRPAQIEAWVRENYPETITLILTAHDKDYYLKEMMDAGVAGYFNKDVRTEKLVAGIRRAANDEKLFTNEQFNRVLQWNEIAGNKWQSLTKREREILKLLAHGLNNDAISSNLVITERTAIYHVTNILKKLKITSRQEAIAWAIKYIPEMSEDL